jgi:hypothetical protein
LLQALKKQQVANDVLIYQIDSEEGTAQMIEHAHEDHQLEALLQ